MKTRIILSSLACLLALAIALPVNQASAQTIAGKWLAKADAPNGPVELVFEIRQEGSQLSGTALVFETTTPISDLRFDGGKFSGEITVMGGNYRLTAALNEGKMAGTWEQVGDDLKGTWTAEREAAAPAATGIAGTWDGSADAPDGTRTFQMQLQQSGDSLTGQIPTPDGTVTLQKMSFSGGKLVFEVDYMGGTYRIEATLEGNSLNGKWSAVDGSDSGPFTAQKKNP